MRKGTREDLIAKYPAHCHLREKFPAPAGHWEGHCRILKADGNYVRCESFQVACWWRQNASAEMGTLRELEKGVTDGVVSGRDGVGSGCGTAGRAESSEAGERPGEQEKPI